MFTLNVCRRLDNRVENLPDDSPRAVELHNLRAHALHDVLDLDESWRVVSWGATDDAKPHEWVELWIALKDLAVQVAPVAVPALTFVGKALVEAGVAAATAEAVKALIAKFRKKQQANELRDANLTLPSGSSAISCHPDGGILTITVCRQISVGYDASPTDLAALESTTGVPIEIPLPLVPAARELIKKWRLGTSA